VKYWDTIDTLATCKGLLKNEVCLLEKDFVQYIGGKFAIGTSYGRTALYLGLKAIDVQNLDVIVPAFTCTVVRHAVVMAGGNPKFVDIDMEDFTFDLHDLRQKISERTRAIILIHYFGRVARNMDDVIKIAKQNNIVLVEDCAHSLGAEFYDKKIGTFGAFSVFSLTKSTINFGGGILATTEDYIYQNARKILEQEKNSIKRRIVDFPLILAYGLEQIADKLVFDRVNKSIFKWWLINVPKLLVTLRRYIIKSIKFPSSIIRLGRRAHKPPSHHDKRKASSPYDQGIHMEPIIAALARTQLRKLDRLIEQRKNIYSDIAKVGSYHFKTSDQFQGRDVYTHMVTRFPSTDIFKLIKKCKKRGVLLRPTWPTHQRLWEHQSTDNVRAIERQIVTWNVNPMLKPTEINNFIALLNECQSGTF